MIKIYVAHAMTGRSKRAVLKESCEAASVAGTLRRLGYDVRLLDPAIVEGVKDEKGVIAAAVSDMPKFWARDKELIREAHVLIDLTGPRKSEGVAHEIGYARFALWKPVIRVYPGLSENSVARFEDDVIVETVTEAIYAALSNWGTQWQRVQWRLRMLNKSLPRWLVHQIQGFK